MLFIINIAWLMRRTNIGLNIAWLMRRPLLSRGVMKLLGNHYSESWDTMRHARDDTALTLAAF